MNKVLVINNLSKSFKDYSSEFKRIFSWFGLNFKPIKEHKVLNNINFSIAPGEAIGIVGQNGAGKSTLLKLITGTLKPSAGTIHIYGRISAILELGMGFHPDLTGRQNVYHSSGLMGYTNEQIDKVIKEIEDFAEIGEYFDQPVRTYSSGMQLRVAFGVVTAYRPEILIVDEALSVGDAYFQHKSLAKIKEFQKQGTTLLLVSHDRGAIQTICSRAILLEKGTIIKDGNPEDIMNFYNALIAEKENSTIKQVTKKDNKIELISGTGEAKVLEISILNKENKVLEYIPVGEAIKLRIKIQVFKDIEQLVFGYMIKDRLGQEIFGTNTYHYHQVVEDAKEGEFYEILFAFNMNLGVGSYSVSTAIHANDTHLSANYEWKDQSLIFNVINISKKDFLGSTWIEQDVKVNNVK